MFTCVFLNGIASDNKILHMKGENNGFYDAFNNDNITDFTYSVIDGIGRYGHNVTPANEKKSNESLRTGATHE